MDETALFSFLCTSSQKAVAHRLLQLVQSYPEELLSTKLLSAVSDGRVPPSVFAVWLTISLSPGKIVDALRQDDSVSVRRCAISWYGRHLRSQRWKGAWDALGGVLGILELSATLSVYEVKRLMAVISCCNHKHDEDKARRITQLLQCLLSPLYPAAPFKNLDDRPLYRQYARLVPACSTAFVHAFLYDDSHPIRPYAEYTRLRMCDSQILQQLALDCTMGGLESHLLTRSMQSALFASSPSGHDDATGLSTCMAFSLNTLRQVASRPDAKMSTVTILNDLVGPLWRRAMRKRGARKYLPEIVALTNQCLKTRVGSGGPLNTYKNSMFHYLVSGWSRERALYEDHLTEYLEWHASNGHDRLVVFRELSHMLQRPQRYALLTLLLLHDKEKPLDIEVEAELRSSTLRWDCDTFLELDPDNAAVLLRRLLRAKPAASFLDAKHGPTILSYSPNPSAGYGDTALLLTLLERGHDEALERAEGAVEARRKKAASSREQPDRAFWAVSALMMAIASGSRTLYGETVNWARRYIRDALTSQTVFGRPTNTQEGIALLSGVPSGRLASITVAEIRQSVVHGNDVLFSFLQIYAEAQREPHFRAGHWAAVLALSGQVMDARAKGAVEVQRQFQLTNRDLYDTLWAETLTTLLSMKGHEEEAHNLYIRISDIVPTTSLVALATTALDQLIATPDHAERIAPLEHVTYALLSALASSDCPQEACNLVLRSVVDRPDASSWHRRALSVRLLKRLPAASAQSLLLSFAKSIGQKLTAQAASMRKGSQTTPAKATVKVTTVKYLAQLLDNAEFISPSFAVTVLAALLRDASHIDIRVAVVESMLTMLAQCTADSMTPLASKLLTALEETIPIVSDINERRPMQEQDWIEAASTKTLPEVYSDGGMTNLAPLLSKLVYWNPSGSKWRRHLIQRVLLPVIDASVMNHARWTQIFLDKHESTLSAQDLPSLPVKPRLLSALIQSSITLLPSSVLDMHQQFVLLNINPPAGLQTLTQKVLNDATLRESNEGQYWRALYDQRTRPCNLGAHSLVMRLRQPWPQPEISHGVTIAQIQRLLLEQANTLVRAGSAAISDPSTHSWHTLTQAFLAHPHPLETRLPEAERRAFLDIARPVLQRMVDDVESLRTPKWQSDPDRKPTILPATFQERLWLLPYPAPSKPQDQEDRLDKICTDFVRSVNERIVQLAHRHLPCTDELELLKTAVLRLESKLRSSVALAMVRDDDDDEFDQADLHSTSVVLQSVLVEILLTGASWSKERENVGREVLETKDLIRKWRESPIEEVRVTGWRIWRALKEKETALFQDWD